MDRQATRLIERFSINCTGPDAPMFSLSGGNQQRVVMARELSHDPRVLVAAQPTRGLDVGAIEYLSEQIRAAAAKGVGVLLISTELDEVLDLSHRILVIANGRAMVQAGAGIVADSNPAAEFQETEDKAKALIRALELAQEGL